MQSGCSCRKENKDGNPKANRSIKRQDEKGIPFLFLWIHPAAGHIRKIYLRASQMARGSPTEGKEKICRIVNPKCYIWLTIVFSHCYTSPIEAGWREIV